VNRRGEKINAAFFAVSVKKAFSLRNYISQRLCAAKICNCLKKTFRRLAPQKNLTLIFYAAPVHNGHTAKTPPLFGKRRRGKIFSKQKISPV
jgi:hypothetical protein